MLEHPVDLTPIKSSCNLKVFGYNIFAERLILIASRCLRLGPDHFLAH